MIKSGELRLGNYLMHKTGVRILTVRCTFTHFGLMASGSEKDFFPLVLTPKILESCGFIENKKYPLLPESREFVRPLPVMGGGDVNIKAYIKSNKECFARLMLANVPISTNVNHLHQLQNLCFALTGEELEVTV